MGVMAPFSLILVTKQGHRSWAASDRDQPAAAEGDETGEREPKLIRASANETTAKVSARTRADHPSSKAPANETTAQGERADPSRPPPIQSALIETGPLRRRERSSTGARHPNASEVTLHLGDRARRPRSGGRPPRRFAS